MKETERTDQYSTLESLSLKLSGPSTFTLAFCPNTGADIVAKILPPEDGKLLKEVLRQQTLFQYGNVTPGLLRILYTWNDGGDCRVTQTKTERYLGKRYICPNQRFYPVHPTDRALEHFSAKYPPAPIPARKGFPLVPYTCECFRSQWRAGDNACMTLQGKREKMGTGALVQNAVWHLRAIVIVGEGHDRQDTTHSSRQARLPARVRLSTPPRCRGGYPAHLQFDFNEKILLAAALQLLHYDLLALPATSQRTQQLEQCQQVLRFARGSCLSRNERR